MDACLIDYGSIFKLLGDRDGEKELLSLAVLGSFWLRLDEREVPLSKKAQALLAYLALHLGEPIARDRLAYLLWPDQSNDLARHGVRNALHDIRRSLGPLASVALQSDNKRVAFDVNYGQFDLVQFESVARIENIATLISALTLYRGEFLSDIYIDSEPFNDWLSTTRQRIADLAAHLFVKTAKYASEQGDHGLAIEAARRLVGLDPLTEASHRTLIEIYLRSGRRADALRQLNTCKEIMRRELGVGLEPITLALAQSVNLIATRRPETPKLLPSNHAPSNASAAPLPAAALSAEPLRGPLEQLLTRNWFKPERLSLSVSTLRNLSGGALDDELAEALTEDLAQSLADVGRGFVVSRANSPNGPFPFGRLDNRYIVTGNIQPSGADIRVSIALLDSATGQYLWTERYLCRRSSLQEVQPQLADRIAGALHTHVILDVARDVLQDPEKNPSQLVSEGIFLLSRSSRHGLSLISDAQICFLRALAHDARNVDALSGLGQCCFRLGSHPYWLPASTLRPAIIKLGRQLMRAAVTINPNHAYAHCVEGFLASLAGDIEYAQEAVARAATLDPGSALACSFAGFNAAFLGRAGEAAPAAERALTLDPNHSGRGAWLFTAGAGELLLGRHGQARDLLKTALTVDNSTGTTRLWLAAAAALDGRKSEASQTMNEFRERYPGYRLVDFDEQFVNRSGHPIYRRQVDVITQQIRQLGIPG